MKLSLSSFVVELAFLAGYPASSVILAILGLEGLWNPWIIVATSFVLFYTGLVLYNPTQKCLPQDRSQSIIILFLFFSMFSSTTYATISGRGDWIYAALAWFLALVMGNLVVWVLEKLGVDEMLKELSSRRILFFIWFIYILSASVPTSLGLARINHVIDLVPTIVFAVTLGWVGPEVIPRIIPGFLRSLFLIVAHPFLLALLYMFLEAINPAFSYPTLTLLDALLLSYISCYAMLASRSAFENFKRLVSDEE